MAIDTENNVYIGDTDNHRIVVLNQLTGDFVRAFGTKGSGQGDILLCCCVVVLLYC